MSGCVTPDVLLFCSGRRGSGSHQVFCPAVLSTWAGFPCLLSRIHACAQATWPVPGGRVKEPGASPFCKEKDPWTLAYILLFSRFPGLSQQSTTIRVASSNRTLFSHSLRTGRLRSGVSRTMLPLNALGLFQLLALLAVLGSPWLVDTSFPPALPLSPHHVLSVCFDLFVSFSLESTAVIVDQGHFSLQ